MVKALLETFPDARFVHVVRDGRDAAISMEKHLGFRAALRPFLPEQFELDALRAYRVPLPLFAEFYWVRLIENGLKVISALPDGRVLTLRYEDFFIDPKRQLDTLTAFLGDDFIDGSANVAPTLSLSCLGFGIKQRASPNPHQVEIAAARAAGAPRRRSSTPGGLQTSAPGPSVRQELYSRLLH
jgi:hypothetical protein